MGITLSDLSLMDNLLEEEILLWREHTQCQYQY